MVIGLFITGCLLLALGSYLKYRRRRADERARLSDRWRLSDLGSHEDERRKADMVPAAGRDY